MDWIASWPSVIFGSVGLGACVIGLLIEQLQPEPKQQPKQLQPEDIRRMKKKAATRDSSTDSGKNIGK